MNKNTSQTAEILGLSNTLEKYKVKKSSTIIDNNNIVFKLGSYETIYPDEAEYSKLNDVYMRKIA
jgi:hypothetical protein